MKKTMILALGLALAIPAGASTCPSWQQADRANWTCAQFDGTMDIQARVIQNQAAWDAFWKAQTGQATAPAVDFTREVIVVHADGSLRAERAALGSQQVFSWQQQAAAQQQNLGAAAGNRVAQALSSVGFSLKSDDSSSGKAAAYDAAFDGSLRDAVASPAALAPASAASVNGLQKAQANCTPGIDCPTPQNPPRQQQPNCTPGIDCPQNGGQQPSCTPNVDCPGDGSGSGNGNAPLPPNYEPRPSNPPSSFPPVGSPSYHDSPVDSTSYWMTYRDWLGRADEEYGNWSNTTGTSVVSRGGKDVGSQGTDYTATLQSSAERNVYRLYWRYAGHNCNPNDASQCESWSVEYAYFYDRTENGQTKSVNVEVAFSHDKTLLPWEKESITLTFDGGQVGVDTSGAAFNYSVRGPILDQQRGTAYVELTPTSRILRRPEADKVSMTLVKGGSGLQLVVDDSRDQYYDGESLEITVQVKMDSGHWYSRDKVVFERKDNGPISVRIAAGKHPQAVVDVPSQGSGKYYIKSWSFRRAQSKISSADWIERDKGNSVQY